MLPPETRYVRRRDGVSIAYQVFGEGPVDLLYAQGLISHLDLQWTDPGFTRFLQRLGSFARVIAFDKAGTGLSDPVDHLATLEERVDEMRLVLDAAGSERAALFGVSEGGPACVLFAATEPERVSRLIVYGSFPAGRPPADRPPDVEPAEYEDWMRSAHALYDRSVELHQTWGRGHVVDVFAPSAANPIQRRFWAVFERAAASPGMARALLEAVRGLDIVDILPTVAVPTLVVHRTGDVMPIQAARFMASRIPGARMAEFPGDDHAFWFGDFDPIVDEIEAFVTGDRAPARPDRVLATVLFTDIVRSTERAAELGDRRWRDLLERHDAVVAGHVSDFRGRVVKSLGDGALAVFDGPARAIRCAQALRDALGDAGVPIRAGVHTGECEVLGDDVGGIAVHIGARVAALADAGEVLVSSTVADLVVGSGLAFDDRGTHQLKGVPGEWRVLALADGRAAEPEPIRPHQLSASDRMTVSLARRAPRAIRVAQRLTRRA